MHEMHSPKCWGTKQLVLGLIVLANIYYLKWSWAQLIGWLLIVMGLIHIIMPGCCKGKKR